MQVASTGEGNASAAIFGVKNRSQEEWKDKHDIDHTTNGESINRVERVIIDPTNKDS